MSDDTPYRVGRGKPPIETRWPKGKSGNPKGRPKGAMNRAKSRGITIFSKELEDIILREAYRPLRVIDGEKTFKMPGIQALVRTLIRNGAKGNRLAAKDMLQLTQRIEAERHQQSIEEITKLGNYQENAGRLFEDARRSGQPDPNITPHPDDIIFDLERQEVRIDGPLAPEGKQALDDILAMRDRYQGRVSLFAEQFAEAKGTKQRGDILMGWHRAQDMYDRLNDPLGKRYRKTLTDRSYAEGATHEGQFAAGWEPPQWLPKEEN